MQIEWWQPLAGLGVFLYAIRQIDDLVEQRAVSVVAPSMRQNMAVGFFISMPLNECGRKRLLVGAVPCPITEAAVCQRCFLL